MTRRVRVWAVTGAVLLTAGSGAGSVLALADAASARSARPVRHGRIVVRLRASR